MAEKIVLVIPSLTHGGAERILSLLAESLAQKGNDVTVLTLYNRKDFYVLKDNIKRRRLILENETRNLVQAILANISRIRKIRSAILDESPAVVISFLNRTNIRTLIALRNTNIPVIISERSHPKFNKIGIIWSILRRCWYKKAFCLVSPSKGVDNFFKFIPEPKRLVIYNPVTIPLYREADSSYSFRAGRKNILSVGRLVRDKNHEMLIRAFAGIAIQLDNWDLTIIGEGILRRKLEILVSDFHLHDRVFLPGLNKTPEYLMRSADFFVLSSRWEGFGNVLIEAQSQGCPVLSTDCPTGPKEILGNSALLVDNDEASLRDGMIQMAHNSKLREHLKKEGLKNIERFSTSVIFNEWSSLIQEARK